MGLKVRVLLSLFIILSFFAVAGCNSSNDDDDSSEGNTDFVLPPLDLDSSTPAPDVATPFRLQDQQIGIGASNYTVDDSGNITEEIQLASLTPDMRIVLVGEASEGEFEDSILVVFKNLDEESAFQEVRIKLDGLVLSGPETKVSLAEDAFMAVQVFHERFEVESNSDLAPELLSAFSTEENELKVAVDIIVNVLSGELPDGKILGVGIYDFNLSIGTGIPFTPESVSGRLKVDPGVKIVESFQIFNQEIFLDETRISFDEAGVALETVRIDNGQPIIRLKLDDIGPKGVFRGNIVIKMVQELEDNTEKKAFLNLTDIIVSGPETNIQLGEDALISTTSDKINVKVSDTSPVTVNKNELLFDIKRYEDILGELPTVDESFLSEGSYEYTINIYGRIPLTPNKYSGNLDIGPELLDVTSTPALLRVEEIDLLEGGAAAEGTFTQPEVVFVEQNFTPLIEFNYPTAGEMVLKLVNLNSTTEVRVLLEVPEFEGYQDGSQEFQFSANLVKPLDRIEVDVRFEQRVIEELLEVTSQKLSIDTNALNERLKDGLGVGFMFDISRPFYMEASSEKALFKWEGEPVYTSKTCFVIGGVIPTGASVACSHAFESKEGKPAIKFHKRGNNQYFLFAINKTEDQRIPLDKVNVNFSCENYSLGSQENDFELAYTSEEELHRIELSAPEGLSSSRISQVEMLRFSCDTEPKVLSNSLSLQYQSDMQYAGSEQVDLICSFGCLESEEVE